MPAQLKSRRRGGEKADDFLACRTYNHAWDRFHPINMDRPYYGWRLSLRCLRCSAERHDVISYRTGEVEQRRYIYPEGYQYEGVGEDRPTKEQFREELFTILRGELEKDNALASEESAPKKRSPRKSNVTPIKSARKKSA